MAEIICSICGKAIEGYTVYDGEMNPMHPGCAPKDFNEQAKAERKAAKKDHVGVRKQRKIDSLWNRRGRKIKKQKDLTVEINKVGKEIGEIDAELKDLDPKFEEKMADLDEQEAGEVLA
jgi:hypothetical protein